MLEKRSMEICLIHMLKASAHHEKANHQDISLPCTLLLQLGPKLIILLASLADNHEDSSCEELFGELTMTQLHQTHPSHGHRPGGRNESGFFKRIGALHYCNLSLQLATVYK